MQQERFIRVLCILLISMFLLTGCSDQSSSTQTAEEKNMANIL